MPGVRLAALQTHGGIEGALARLQASLDRFETGQVKTLNALEESYDAKARRMRGILADLGLDSARSRRRAGARARGGPFVPASAEPASRRSTASSTASGSRAGKWTG